MDREWLLNKLAQIRATGEYRVLRMDFPPATEEQLLETERRLGFPLPEALRILYGEVANGGDIMNNGALIFGAVGGCPPLWESKDSTIDHLVSRSDWRLDAETDARLQSDPTAHHTGLERPEGFVSFADLGCMITAEWDGLSGRVYSAEPSGAPADEVTERGQEPSPDSGKQCYYAIQFLAPSVEAFFADAIEYRLTEWPTPSEIIFTDGVSDWPRPSESEWRARIEYAADPFAGEYEDPYPHTDADEEELPVTSYRVLGPDER